MTDLATYLRPAFIAGAIFLVIVGGGVLVMMRVRFPRANAETAAAAMDLRRAGLAVTVFGVGVGVAATWLIPSMGPWILAVPGAIIAVGLAFALTGHARCRA